MKLVKNIGAYNNVVISVLGFLLGSILVTSSPVMNATIRLMGTKKRPEFEMRLRSSERIEFRKEYVQISDAGFGAVGRIHRAYKSRKT